MPHSTHVSITIQLILSHLPGISWLTSLLLMLLNSIIVLGSSLWSIVFAQLLTACVPLVLHVDYRA